MGKVLHEPIMSWSEKIERAPATGESDWVFCLAFLRSLSGNDTDGLEFWAG
jgi:hypothetical protein